MERRDFLRCTAATSVGAMTGTALAGTKDTQTGSQIKKCKITILKRLHFKELYQKYTGSEGEICNRFKDGQEFIVTSPYRMPEGFCQWAWADIRMYIMSFCFGKQSTSIVCCTDAYKPVIFKIEPAE